MLLRMMRGFALFAVAGATVLAVLPLDPAPTLVFAQEDDSALGLIKEGLREYKRGNWARAIQKFDEALAKDPTDDDARRIRDEISEELARNMINNNLADPTLSGRYSRFGKWVMAGRAKSPAMGRNNNPDEIREFVDAYMADADTARNMLRAGRIRDAYGDFAIPHIQANYMGSDNQDSRYRARNLLSVIGAAGVNALIQVMQSPNMYDRQTAALALADIGDPRALPALAACAANADEDEQVRQACQAGVEKIRAGMAEQGTRAATPRDLWYLQAEAYYRNNAAGRYYRNRLVGSTYPGNLPVVMYGYDRSYTVWRWYDEDGAGSLRAFEVPLWAFADLLAEEAAVNAVALGVATAEDPRNDAWVIDAEALLACIRFHMYSEAQDRYYNASEEERAFITNLLAEGGVVAGKIGAALGATVGSSRLYAALERSLADGYPEVSIAICDALAELGDSTPVGTNAASALTRALGDPDKRIRYAAARALVSLGAKKDTGVNAMVEQVAIRNLQETAARSVLVIAEDEALRNRYLSDIESLGISARGASNLEEGADLAVQAPVFDAIIVQGSLVLAPIFTWEPPTIPGSDRTSEARMETLFDVLSKDIRTAQTPVLVACLDAEVDDRRTALAGRLDAQQFITYSAEYESDATGLADLLTSLWERNPESAKSRANRMVADMASALAALDPATTKYNVESLLVALAGGLRLPGRDPASRAAICDALGALIADKSKLDAGWARANLVPNLLDTINSTELVDTPGVKAAAARALGACYAAHPACYDDDGFTALMSMLRLQGNLDGIEDAARRDQAVAELVAARTAAGTALGRAPTTPQQRAQINAAQAVLPHRAPPAIPAGQ